MRKPSGLSILERPNERRFKSSRAVLTGQLSNPPEPLARLLERLNRFREHGYWHLPPERRLPRLIVELRMASPALKIEQLAHKVMVLDLLFLFAISILGACRHVSAMSLHDPKEALVQYLLGGPAATRERRQQLDSLASGVSQLEAAGVAPAGIGDAFRLEPEYFDALAETVARYLRRPRDAQRVLRYIEWWSQCHEALGLPPAPEALGSAYGDYTRKLVSDSARTCFAAAGLDPNWMELASRAGASFEDGAPAAGDAGDQPRGPAERSSEDREEREDRSSNAGAIDQPQLALDSADPERKSEL